MILAAATGWKAKLLSESLLNEFGCRLALDRGYDSINT